MSQSLSKPEQWILEEVERSQTKLRTCSENLRQRIAEKPMESAAIAFAAGYLGRSLPLVGIAAGTVKLAARLAPPTILGLGCVRLWSYLQSGSVQSGADEVPEARI